MKLCKIINPTSYNKRNIYLLFLIRVKVFEFSMEETKKNSTLLHGKRPMTDFPKVKEERAADESMFEVIFSTGLGLQGDQATDWVLFRCHVRLPPSAV